MTSAPAPTEFLRVSDSSLNTFASCARKFEFNKLYPRRKRDNDSFAADVGSALHAGFQEFLISGDEDRALWALLNKYPYELEYQQEKDDRSTYAAISTLEEMISNTSMYEYELARIMRPATPEELLANPDVLRYEAPAIEVPFEITLGGIVLPDGRGVKYTGFIDAIMRSQVTGLFRTLDIKTHRRHLRDATAKYLFAGQQIPYGIVVDHIAGQPVEEFNVLYYDCFVDLVEPRVQMYEFTKYRDDMQEWLLDTVMTVRQIQTFMEMNHFPRTKGGCMSFNSPCYFLDVCPSRSREDIEIMLLMGDEPAPERVDTPWIIGEIDVFGGE